MSNSTVINKVLSTGFVVGVVASSFSGLNTEASIMNSYTSLLETGFRDVPLDSPFSRNIISLREANVISGFPDSTFRPAQRVTRAEMSKFIFNGFEIEQNLSCAPFPDVNSSNGFFRFVTSLRCNNIIAGFPDGLYRPDNSVTRGEMAKFIVNAAGFKVNASAGFFPDAPTGNTFASEISTLKCLGVVRGFEDGTYKPGNTVTRGEMAAFIDRARNVDPSTTECVADGEDLPVIGEYTVSFEVREDDGDAGTFTGDFVANTTITARNITTGETFTVTTDANGKVSQALPAGGYTYTATNADFVTANGSFVVDSEDKTVQIELAEPVEFTITVVNQSDGRVAGAAVNIGGNVLTTDANGQVKVNLEDQKSYNLSVSKENFTQTDTFQVKPVDGSIITATVTLRDIATMTNDVTFKITGPSGNVSADGIIRDANGTIEDTNGVDDEFMVPGTFELPNGNYTYNITIPDNVLFGFNTDKNLSVTEDTTVEYMLSRVTLVFQDQDGNNIGVDTDNITLNESSFNTTDIPFTDGQYIINSLVPFGSYVFEYTDGVEYNNLTTTVTIDELQETIVITLTDVDDGPAETAGYIFPVTNQNDHKPNNLLGSYCTDVTIKDADGVEKDEISLPVGSYTVSFDGCGDYEEGSFSFNVTESDLGGTVVVPVQLQETIKYEIEVTNDAAGDYVLLAGERFDVTGGVLDLPGSGTYTYHRADNTIAGNFTVNADGTLTGSVDIDVNNDDMSITLR